METSENKPRLAVMHMVQRVSGKEIQVLITGALGERSDCDDFQYVRLYLIA